MTSLLAQADRRRSSVLAAVAITLLATAIVVGAWLLGSALAPTPGDAAMARADAYEQAYDDARADTSAPVYADAWQQSFPVGAAQGRREGAAAGADAARRSLR